MDSMKRSPRNRHLAGALAATVLACALAAAQTVTAQTGDHWVGTWSTATVGRPQSTPPPAGGGGGRGRGGPAPFMQNQCPPNPAPPPGFVHFTNQTLRQIVHTSVGGSRLGSSSATPSAPSRSTSAPRTSRFATRTRRSRPSTARKLTFSGRRLVHDSARRGRLQRSGRSRPFPRQPTWRSTVPAGRHQHAVAADHAHHRGADQLRLRGGESHRQPPSCRRRRRPRTGSSPPGRRAGPGLRWRPRRLRRFDHRRHALDAGHQQPLAGSAGPADAGAEPAAADGRDERGDRRQPRAERRQLPGRHQRAGALRSPRRGAAGRHARDLHGGDQRHRPGTREPDAVGRRRDRRPQADHRARARAGA